MLCGGARESSVGGQGKCCDRYVWPLSPTPRCLLASDRWCHILLRMSPFASRYNEQQREALAVAFVDDGVRPANRVVEMAALGKLEVRGQRVEPFEAHPDSVRHFARVLRKRRADAKTSELLAAPPHRAVETLRRRLVALVEMETQRIERQQADSAAPPVPGEVLRQLARALREIAALPGPTDERPPAPGEKRDGVRVGGETRGGLAARALALHRERRPETHEPRRD